MRSVLAVDLGEDLSGNVVGSLRSALGEHGVLYFRDQDIAPEAHIAFAEKFGAINVNRFFAHVDGYPQIAEVLKEPHHEKNVGSGWHTDHTYDQSPALGSALYAKEVPSSGGDTLFANTAQAYDTLSDGMKALIGGLRGVNNSEGRYPGGRAAAMSRLDGMKTASISEAEGKRVSPRAAMAPLTPTKKRPAITPTNPATCN